MANLSKVYEDNVSQIYAYLQTKFSKFQCGFWTGFNAHHCLLVMVERWRKTVDESGETRLVLIELSRTFDCIDHNFLIATFNGYPFLQI